MKVFDIYSLLSIPPNLERHMFQVAKVAEFIAQHWSAEPIDSKLILKICLLHDLGNIVKFKKPYWEELFADSEHWEKIQAQMTNRYGSNAFEATNSMLQELGVDQTLQQAVKNLRLVVDDNAQISWEVKIAEYADCCVSPEGIGGFESRLKDFQTRYPETDPKIWEGLKKNAEVLSTKVSTDLADIAQLSISDGDVERYRKVEIELNE